MKASAADINTKTNGEVALPQDSLSIAGFKLYPPSIISTDNIGFHLLHVEQEWMYIVPIFL